MTFISRSKLIGHNGQKTSYTMVKIVGHKQMESTEALRKVMFMMIVIAEEMINNNLK